MKYRTISLLLAVLLAVCFSGIAQAQIRFNVPFGFTVGSKTLPAGRYSVAPVSDMDRTAWRLSNDHGTVMVLTSSIESPNKIHRTSLVFVYAQDQYFLAQIWSSEHAGKELFLKPKVTTIILAGSARYVEIGAE